MIKEAKWIACGKDCEAPVIKKVFYLKSPKSASIDITGLGYFELHVNGKRVSDDYLVPALTDYQTRALPKLAYPLSDTFSHRICYLNYDITQYVTSGENQIEIYLGNGWYRQNERIAEGIMSFGEQLIAIFSASIFEADGSTQTVQSDGSETYTPSFITYSNLYVGEVQDARKLHTKETPLQVSVIPAPDGALELQTCPPDRIIRTITPQLINFVGNRKVYDAGENISGWVQVRTKGKSGDKITLRFSEVLNEQGMPDYQSTSEYYVCASGKTQIQTDIFICNGEEIVFEPKFAFHTFRYFDVEGEAEEFTVVVVHSDVPVTSTFHSGNEALNWLYSAFIRTQLDNMHGGVPSDCPHRERLGYTGDGQVISDSGMMLLDSKTFYEKWIWDIMDCQDQKGGHVQHTAPFMGGGGGPCGWGGAVVVVPYYYYRNFGDIELLQKWYPNLKKWVQYIKAHSEDYLVTTEEKGGWCLGDWAALDKMTIPEPFVNTCYFVKTLKMLVEIAAVLERLEDVQEYTDYITRTKEALKRHYFNPETGSFCDGVQGADAFALDIDLSEDSRTIDNLSRKYKELGFYDTGFLGTDILTDVLFRYGCKDVAYKLLTTEKKGGYLWMKEHGATTIWEYYDGKCSHCHPMFGTPVRYLFKNLLGIKQAESSVAFQLVEISPAIPQGLNYCFGKISTVQGEISVSWNRDGENINLFAAIPEKVHAVLLYNSEKTVLDSGENKISFKA